MTFIDDSDRFSCCRWSFCYWNLFISINHFSIWRILCHPTACGIINVIFIRGYIPLGILIIFNSVFIRCYYLIINIFSTTIIVIILWVRPQVIWIRVLLFFPAILFWLFNGIEHRLFKRAFRVKLFNYFE
jgi:hypothetical protein